MLYVVLLDGLSDPGAALEWLEVEGEHASKLQHAKRLNTIVCCHPTGELARYVRGKGMDCVGCLSVEEACLEAGRVLGSLGHKLAGTVVCLVTFQESGPVTSIEEHWTALVQTRIMRIDGADECFCSTAPPSLGALLDQMPASAFAVAKTSAKPTPTATPPRRASRERQIVSQCNRCRRTLWSDADREEHSRTIPCDTCGRLFCTRKAMAVHVDSQHPRCTDETCRCEAVFADAAALHKHYTNLHKPVTCGLCQQKFNSIKCVAAHALQTHPPMSTLLPVHVLSAGNRSSKHMMCKKCGALGKGHSCLLRDADVQVPVSMSPSPARLHDREARLSPRPEDNRTTLTPPTASRVSSASSSVLHNGGRQELHNPAAAHENSSDNSSYTE